jgi:hypothetical protein
MKKRGRVFFSCGPIDSIRHLLNQILDHGHIGLAAASPGGRRQFAHLRKARRRKQSQAGKDAHQCLVHKFRRWRLPAYSRQRKSALRVGFAELNPLLQCQQFR